MDRGQQPVRHTISEINPSLIESWCLKCGVFIAASKDVRKLQTVEGIHSCPGAVGDREPTTPRPPTPTGSM